MTPDTIDSSNYFYDEQFKKYIVQFAEIFAQMKVKTGKNDYNTDQFIYVPVKYGSMDRVVAHIKTSNTQNKPISLPIMVVNLNSIEMSPESRKGIGQESRTTKLPLGGSMPDDVTVTYKSMPIPYKFRMELSILVSNTDQHFQLLEQILMLFDPSLQLYTSDSYDDWTKICTVELDNINMDEIYPAENNARQIKSTLMFSFIVWLSPPANIKHNFIKSVRLRLDEIATYQNTQEIVKDVDRLYPEYKKLFDIDDYDIPKN